MFSLAAVGRGWNSCLLAEWGKESFIAASSSADPFSGSLKGLLEEDKCAHLLSLVLCTQCRGYVGMRILTTGHWHVFEEWMCTGFSALGATFKEEFNYNSCRPVQISYPNSQTFGPLTTRIHSPACWHRYIIQLQCLVEYKYLTGYFSVWRVTGVLMCPFNGFWGWERLFSGGRTAFPRIIIKRSECRHSFGGVWVKIENVLIASSFLLNGCVTERGWEISWGKEKKEGTLETGLTPCLLSIRRIDWKPLQVSSSWDSMDTQAWSRRARNGSILTWWAQHQMQEAVYDREFLDAFPQLSYLS